MMSRQTTLGFVANEIKCSIQTFQLSKKYIKRFLKIGIFNIMFRRVALPGNEFIHQDYENVEYVTPKRKSTNKFVRNYHGFCLGLLDAFDKDYLKEVFMFIRDKATKEIYETYKFKVKYNKEETHTNTTKPEKVKSATVDFLQALANIPGKKWDADNIELYMEFTFNEETPKEYEPPNFEAASDPLCRNISSPKKHIVLLGSVNSGFHKVSAWGEGKNFVISRASTPAPPVIVDEDEDFLEGIELDSNSQPQSIEESVENVEPPNKRKKLNATHSDSAFNLTHDSFVADNISVISSEHCVRCICKWSLSDYFETIRCTQCFGIVHLICHGYLNLSAVDASTFKCLECDDSTTIDKKLNLFTKLRIILYGIEVEKTLPVCLASANKEEKDYIMKQLTKLNVYNPNRKSNNGINKSKLNQALVSAFAAENSQFLE